MIDFKLKAPNFYCFLSKFFIFLISLKSLSPDYFQFSDSNWWGLKYLRLSVYLQVPSTFKLTLNHHLVAFLDSTSFLLASNFCLLLAVFKLLPLTVHHYFLHVFTLNLFLLFNFLLWHSFQISSGRVVKCAENLSANPVPKIWTND